MIAKGESFEGRGINPDIWVWRNEVMDLYPYNDKVLRVALRLSE
jgi:C-terminal processing protease CtpA/Prc